MKHFILSLSLCQSFFVLFLVYCCLQYPCSLFGPTVYEARRAAAAAAKQPTWRRFLLATKTSRRASSTQKHDAPLVEGTLASGRYVYRSYATSWRFIVGRLRESSAAGQKTEQSRAHAQQRTAPGVGGVGWGNWDNWLGQ